MGAIGGLMGTAGGVNGTGFSKPVNANILAPTTQDQVNQSNAGVGTSLQNSQALLAALQGQGGAANQNQVFNQGQGLYGQIAGNNGVATQAGAGTQQQTLNSGLTGLNAVGAQGAAMKDQGNLATNLGNAGGIGYQQTAAQGLQNTYASQGNTLDQLQGIANGTGPNPAQAALNQATGQNVANQAALMAGQRGAGANVGLMARQASQQGAATQQQAAGQSATMQAQQQLNAIGAMGAQQQAMGATAQGLAGIGAGLTSQQQAALAQQYGQGAGATGQLQAGIGQQFGQGATTVGQQQGQMGMNAGIAQNQVGNVISATGQNVQGNVANAGQQMGALGNYNAAGVNMQGNINNANTSLANTNMQGQQAMLGGVLNGLGGAMSSGGARGGYVGMADGGDVPAMPAASFAAPNGQGPVMAEPSPMPSTALTPAPPMAPPTAPPAATAPAGPTSALGQYLAGATSTGSFLGSQPISGTPQDKTTDTTANASIQAPPGMGYGSQMLYQGASKAASGIAKSITDAASSMGSSGGEGGGMESMAALAAASRGGKVPALVSEHEVLVPPGVAKSPQKSGQYVGRALATGGDIRASSPDEKAVKNGNSYSNDKIAKDLPEGAIVIPRSVTQSKDPVRSAQDFVAKVLAKRRAS